MKFLFCFYLSFQKNLNYMNIKSVVIVPKAPKVFFTFFFSLFSTCCLDCIIFIVLSSHSLVFIIVAALSLHYSILLLSSFLSFLFWLLYFSVVTLMRSVQKVSSLVMWKTEAFTEEDTRYKKHCTQDNDASAPLKAGTLRSHTVFPIAISCPVVFSWISLWSEISSL